MIWEYEHDTYLWSNRCVTAAATAVAVAVAVAVHSHIIRSPPKSTAARGDNTPGTHMTIVLTYTSSIINW